MVERGNKLQWLAAYGGQTADQLLSLEGEYRIDSLVVAFEQALCQKEARLEKGALSPEEQVVLAVEALEREVNNGGYAQFFQNSSREYASVIVDSLRHIGCVNTAVLTERAIKAVGSSKLESDAIKTAMAMDSEARDKTLSECDKEYFRCAEPIAERLFAFIKANRIRVAL